MVIAKYVDTKDIRPIHYVPSLEKLRVLSNYQCTLYFGEFDDRVRSDKPSREWPHEVLLLADGTVVLRLGVHVTIIATDEKTLSGTLKKLKGVDTRDIQITNTA